MLMSHFYRISILKFLLPETTCKFCTTQFHDLSRNTLAIKNILRLKMIVICWNDVRYEWNSKWTKTSWDCKVHFKTNKMHEGKSSKWLIKIFNSRFWMNMNDLRWFKSFLVLRFIYCLVYYDKVSKILLFLNTIVMQSLLLNIYLDYCQIIHLILLGQYCFPFLLTHFDPSIGR